MAGLGHVELAGIMWESDDGPVLSADTLSVSVRIVPLIRKDIKAKLVVAHGLRVDVPGLKAENIHIDILDDVVTLRGEFKSEENGDGKYLLRELHYGEFTRSLRLPDPLDHEKAEANVEDGVLTVRIPKAEEARPKEITVNAR